MILKKIILGNFRNYEALELDFNNKFNFIHGNNGHGKTNILEAVSFISYGKSFLGSGEPDCVRFKAGGFNIFGEYENELENLQYVSADYDLETRRKTYHINKESISSISSSLFGKFPVVFLSPHSLNITYGNPSERRRFFDILISQTSKVYLDDLKKLVKILKQKNALLKNEGRHMRGESRGVLDTYNEKLAETSARIILKRLDFLNEFKELLGKNFSFLVPNGNHGYINYFSDITGEIEYKDFDKYSHEILTARSENLIAEKTGQEIDRGLSLIGPQRDDYLFKLEKDDDAHNSTDIFDLKNHASQGEHKTFIVALKLSEFDYLKNKKNTYPVLLLDDILSELDAERVSKIISHLKDFGQIFLTTIEENYLEDIKKMYNNDEISVFKVSNGNVSYN